MGEKDTFSFLNSHLPRGEAKSTSVKWKWGGINKRSFIDSGQLTNATGISCERFPYLEAAFEPTLKYDMSEFIGQLYNSPGLDDIHPICLDGFSDILLFTFRLGGTAPVVPESYEVDSEKKVIDGSLTGLVTPPTEAAVGRDCTSAIEVSPNTRYRVKMISPPTNGDYIYSYNSAGERVSGAAAAAKDSDNWYRGVFTTGNDTHYVVFETSSDKLGNNNGAYITLCESGIIGMLHVRERVLDDGSRVVDKTAITLDGNSDDTRDLSRSVVQFNVFNSNDVLDGSYDKKLLVFPDRKSFDLYPTTPAVSAADINAAPPLKYACVYQSRLFGADDARIYASGYNDYTNWNVDTADEYLESNAWVTAAGANTKSKGSFTGITPYNGYVVCFKDDMTQRVSGTYNPFTLSDVSTGGAVSDRGIAQAGGYLFYIGENGVMLYTGGNPTCISDALDISDFDGGRLCAYRDSIYLYAAGCIYTYNTKNNQWGNVSWSDTVNGALVNFAVNDEGVFALTKTNKVYMLNSGVYGEWSFETDFMFLSKFAVRRIKKMSLYVEMFASANSECSLCAEIIRFGGSSAVDTVQVLSYDTRSSEKKMLRSLVRGVSGVPHRLRISGSGHVRIYSCELQVSLGGETYV